MSLAARRREQTMPKRIQRRRTKGWRMPAGAVYVGRGSRWGNPWRIKEVGRDFAVRRFRAIARHIFGDADFRELRGKDLCCWCKLSDENGNPVPCHADVLLELANK
jgi:Domain of unknown function (DUF4326)